MPCPVRRRSPAARIPDVGRSLGTYSRAVRKVLLWSAAGGAVVWAVMWIAVPDLDLIKRLLAAGLLVEVPLALAVVPERGVRAGVWRSAVDGAHAAGVLRGADPVLGSGAERRSHGRRLGVRGRPALRAARRRLVDRDAARRAAVRARSGDRAARGGALPFRDAGAAAP